jgi:hypothetical protein
VPQRGRYASYRYLPAAMDAVVSKEREALHAQESTQVATLKAQLDAEGKPWDPSLFKSKYEDESDDEDDIPVLVDISAIKRQIPVSILTGYHMHMSRNY